MPLGIKPTTFRFAGQHSIHGATSARARIFLKKKNFCLAKNTRGKTTDKWLGKEIFSTSSEKGLHSLVKKFQISKKNINNSIEKWSSNINSLPERKFKCHFKNKRCSTLHTIRKMWVYVIYHVTYHLSPVSFTGIKKFGATVLTRTWWNRQSTSLVAVWSIKLCIASLEDDIHQNLTTICIWPSSFFNRNLFHTYNHMCQKTYKQSY